MTWRATAHARACSSGADGRCQCLPLSAPAAVRVLGCVFGGGSGGRWPGGVFIRADRFSAWVTRSRSARGWGGRVAGSRRISATVRTRGPLAPLPQDSRCQAPPGASPMSRPMRQTPVRDLLCWDLGTATTRPGPSSRARTRFGADRRRARRVRSCLCGSSLTRPSPVCRRPRTGRGRAEPPAVRRVRGPRSATSGCRGPEQRCRYARRPQLFPLGSGCGLRVSRRAEDGRRIRRRRR